jgi:hypothetical protein
MQKRMQNCHRMHCWTKLQREENYSLQHTWKKERKEAMSIATLQRKLRELGIK